MREKKILNKKKQGVLNQQLQNNSTEINADSQNLTSLCIWGR